jgi:hypothetical protein
LLFSLFVFDRAGNNLFGDDVAAFLRDVPPEQRGAHILMELIKPPPSTSVMIRDGAIIESPSVCVATLH